MRHATREDLDHVAELLASLRRLKALTEKKPGVFYRRGRAFIHFHEHLGRIYMDVRLHSDFERLDVTARPLQNEALRAVRDATSSIS